MSNGEETSRQAVAAVEALKEHYSLPSLTVRVPRRFLGLVLPVVIVIVWEALSEVGFLPANRLPAQSVVGVTLLELPRGGELLNHIGVPCQGHE